MLRKEKLIAIRNSERGLTLVEIIVVLVILGTLMAFLGGRIFGKLGSAKRDINKLKMQELKSAVSEFQLRYNKLPKSLNSLINGDDGISGFQKVANEEQLLDAWGNEFLYRLENNGRTYKISTLGADGVEGGSDENFDDSLTGP